MAERARMKTEVGDQSFAHTAARWVLLLPLSLACGVGVGLGFRAFFSLWAWKPASGASLLAEGLSAALAGTAFLSTARSVAPLWKRGVVIALACALLLFNVSQALSAAWSLARHGASSPERTGLAQDLAQDIALASVAAAALALSMRRVPGPGEATVARSRSRRSSP